MVEPPSVSNAATIQDTVARVVFRWDLDKTYLRTEFDSVRDWIRIAFESATQKETVPGASILFKEIKGLGPRSMSILSGSPEQMRRVLETKLRLDGIQWDSFVLKPSLLRLFKGQLRYIRDHVGYKLRSLLAARACWPADTQEVLFGDDAEADAFIYSIYADICRGRINQTDLKHLLLQAHVYDEDIAAICEQAATLPAYKSASEFEVPVVKLFIHLDRVSRIQDFEKYGSRLCPFYNYYQAAWVLYGLNMLPLGSLDKLAKELVTSQGFTLRSLATSVIDMVQRHHLPAVAVQRARQHLPKEESVLPRGEFRAVHVLKEIELLQPSLYQGAALYRSMVPDYLGLWRWDRERTQRAQVNAKRRLKH